MSFERRYLCIDILSGESAKIPEYISKGFIPGSIAVSANKDGYPRHLYQVFYKPQLNELEQAQLRELKRQENWSPESLAAGTADPRLLKARDNWAASTSTTGGTRKNKRVQRSKKTRSTRHR